MSGSNLISVYAGDLVIVAVFLVVLFAATIGAVAFAVNRSNQQYFGKREDERDAKILQLESKVQTLESRIDELTRRLISGTPDPKMDAVIP